MKLIIFTFLFAISSLVASGGTIEVDSLPNDVTVAIRAAKIIKLLSLNPGNEERSNDPNTFHGWPILGQTEISNASDREAFITAIQNYAVPPRRGDGPIKCFIPHHGIQFKCAEHSYGLVMCFTCKHMYIHRSDGTVRYWCLSGDGQVIDRLLNKANVPMAVRP